MSDTGMPQPAGTLGGRIVKVVSQKGQDLTGAWVDGKYVTYQIPGGHSGTVFVASSDFTPDSVMAAVKADAANLAAVTNLTF